MTLRVGTILRLPWWTGSPRAVVVGVARETVRRSRVERRAKITRDVALPGYLVPCPCGLAGCRGSVRFADARSLLRRLA